jgi:uncharacterized protein (TIGR02594 family)
VDERQDDAELIAAVYDERGRERDGVLLHFSGCSRQVQASIAKRLVREKAAALAMLAAEAEALSEQPRWLAVALRERGEKEVAGTGSNPRIEEYFTWSSRGEKPDHVPWCGAFVSFCLGRAGEIEKGRGSARAADWLSWGKALEEPRPGCVVVLEPQAEGASGHVGFWVKEEGGRIHLLAGNQSNMVNIKAYRKTELQENGYRWPD